MVDGAQSQCTISGPPSPIPSFLYPPPRPLVSVGHVVGQVLWLEKGRGVQKRRGGGWVQKSNTGKIPNNMGRVGA